MDHHDRQAIRDLMKAMDHVENAKDHAKSMNCERELADWEKYMYYTPVHSSLASILIVAERVIKARLKLTDAMWNASEKSHPEDHHDNSDTE
jgi:hypothetical protein